MNLLDIMHSEDGTFALRLAEVATRKLVTDVTGQMTPVALGNVSLAGGEGAWRVLRNPQALREVRACSRWFFALIARSRHPAPGARVAGGGNP